MHIPMTHDTANLILIRQAPEMYLKSTATRRRFRRILMRNLRAALRDIPHRFRVEQGHIMLETPKVETACQVLPQVFGLGSFSPIDRVLDAKADLDSLCQTAEALYRETVRGRRYAVRCKRHGTSRLSSREVECRIGAVLNGPGKVDLSNPDIVIHVDLHPAHSYLHSQRVECANGLPIGTQGRVLALMSGGFDSAVAAWYLMRRGANVDYLFCNLGGQSYAHMVQQVTRVLVENWALGSRPRLHIVDFGDLVEDIRAKLPPEIWQIVLKRLMYRAGEAVAERAGAQALVTGEALSQVSSQTLSNLGSIDAVTKMPVLRPLIGFEKSEILQQARRIGTFALSEKIPEYCAVGTARPVVRSDEHDIAHQEAALDQTLLETAINALQTLDVMKLDESALVEPGILTEQIPDGVTFIDCQPPARHRIWHLPGAVNHPADSLGKQFTQLPKDHAYLLYCYRGTRSAVLAEQMQAAGYDVRAFHGDIHKLRKSWKRKGN